MTPDEKLKHMTKEKLTYMDVCHEIVSHFIRVVSNFGVGAVLATKLAVLVFP